MSLEQYRQGFAYAALLMCICTLVYSFVQCPLTATDDPLDFEEIIHSGTSHYRRTFLYDSIHFYANWSMFVVLLRLMEFDNFAVISDGDERVISCCPFNDSIASNERVLVYYLCVEYAATTSSTSFVSWSTSNRNYSSFFFCLHSNKKCKWMPCVLDIEHASPRLASPRLASPL